MQILEIVLLTRHLKQTETFYTHELGLKVLNKYPGRISFAVGRSVLTFVACKKEKPVYHFAITIPKNKLHEAITWASVRFELIPTENNNVISDFPAWNAQAFYFYDNNGNILEFIARFDLDNESSASFEPLSLLNISEIGLVSDDTPELAAGLKRQFGLALFPKQILHENFAAVGDDEGLLILSGVGRHWYPTQDPANKFYTQVKFLSNGSPVDIVLNEGSAGVKPMLRDA